MQRKLAAILSADAAGYSRLMSDDELATVRSISMCRKLVCGLIEQHHGRTVDTPGDNILAEFGSALDAVEAACAMQTQLVACNAELPEHRRMGFRIGVNLGDVIVEDGRVYGDGVNIAARLEALAEVGGICVSGKVHDEVRGKLDRTFDDIGPQTLHNIAAPGRTAAGVSPAAAPAGAGAAAGFGVGSGWKRNARTGSAMFLTACSPWSSKSASTRFFTAHSTGSEIAIPPGSASASRRAAMLTPSP